MVGVAGRSRGCRTCRRRRVKCDERHPTCSRCEKAGYGCEGYIRQRVFVDEVARTIRHAQKLRSSEYARTEIIPQLRSSLEIIPTGIDLSAFQHNIYVSFLISRLFSGGPRLVEWNWMLSQAEDVESEAAQDSIRALSTVYFGRMYRQQEIISEGYVLYSKALRSLNKSLQDTRTAWCLSVLTSAITLQLYEEFIAFSSTGGWLQHAGGVGRLIELRGPQRHQSPRERHLLEVNRMTIILSCLVQKKRCFLEHPEWLSIPWSLDLDSKTPLLQLHDILTAIPGFLEDATALRISHLAPNELKNQHQSLSQKILGHLTELYAWRTTWERTNPSATHEFAPFSTRYSATPAFLDMEPIFPTVIHFSSLTLANEITLYNTTLLTLLNLGSEIIGPGFDPAAPAAAIPTAVTNRALIPSGQAKHPRDIATEICKAVDFHLLERHTSAGAFNLLFPLRLAYQAFEPKSREAGWVRAVMAHVAEVSGFEISRGLGRRDVAG